MPGKHISEVGRGIKSISEVRDLSDDTLTVCLHSNLLRSITQILGFTNILDLNVSLNKITATDGLNRLSKLTSLNLSSNLLQDCDSLIGLSKIRSLQLQFNCISTLSALTLLRKDSPLAYLDIRGNCFDPTNEARSIQSLVGLATLLLHPFGRVHQACFGTPLPCQETFSHMSLPLWGSSTDL